MAYFNCIICGSQYWAKPCRARQYCGRVCYGKAQSEDPQVHEKLRRATEKRWSDPDAVTKQSVVMSNVMKTLHQDPEFSERVRARGRENIKFAAHVANSTGRNMHRSTGRGKKSYHTTTKSFGAVFCRSSYEADLCRLLDEDSSVLWYSTECWRVPYLLDGKVHMYVPDFFVIKTDCKLVIEVKPEDFVNDEVNQVKFEAARMFFKMRGIEFQVWTERELYPANVLP